MSARKNVNRRRFLAGLGGVAVGLPFLETFAPKKAVAAGDDAPPFAIFCRQANGVKQETDDESDDFWPSAAGALTTAAMQTDFEQNDRAVSSLYKYASRLIAIKGIHFAFPGNMCGHSGGGNQCLTAAQVTQDAEHAANLSLAMGESIDNLIARQLTPGVEPLTLYVGSKPGYLDEVLSYRGSMDLRAAENNPFNVYTALFGLSSIDPAALELLKNRRHSVNDLVRTEMQSLLARKDLSAADRARLDLHFQSIRDLEIGLLCGLADSDVAVLENQQPFIEDDSQFETNAKLMMDLIVLAMGCGSARACTLQFGCGNNNTVFASTGYSYHKISHRIDSDGDTGPAIANAAGLHHEIDKIHAGLFQYLLDKLDEVPLTTGTLLDAGVAVWLNDLGNKYHSYDDVPFILAGGAKGALKTGQFIDSNGAKITNNLLLNTIGAAVGCENLAGNGGPLDDFGDPSLPKGRIDELVA
jgi:hypothetical protein